MIELRAENGNVWALVIFGHGRDGEFVDVHLMPFEQDNKPLRLPADDARKLAEALCSA